MPATLQGRDKNAITKSHEFCMQNAFGTFTSYWFCGRNIVWVFIKSSIPFQANGFLKASGIAGGIPEAYTGLALYFLDRVSSSKQTDRITMYEYIRPGWTYHAKGLWYYPPGEDTAVLTLVGSSNFGEFSFILGRFLLLVYYRPAKSWLWDPQSFIISLTISFSDA